MGEGDESRKRKNPDGRKDGNAPEIVSFSDGDLLTVEIDDGDDEELGIEEEKVVEVMKKLEEEICSPSPGSPSRFLDPRPRVSSREESCGSSFSDSASTVMASVDGTSTLAAGVAACLIGVAKDRDQTAAIWPWAVEKWEVVGPCGGKGPEMEEEEEEEEWLARVLSGPGFEWEECFL